MDRREFTVALLAGGCGAGAQAQLGGVDATSFVRSTLVRATDEAVSRLGRPGGFLDDPQVRIPLPGVLGDLMRFLRMSGKHRGVEDVEVAMNRAAEAALAAARELLVATARQLPLADALRIVGGGDTAAADYFAERTREPLSARLLPIVERETARADLAVRYDALVAQAAGFGVAPGDAASVGRYVTARALDALYRVVADEERRIRADPGAEILRRLRPFGR